MPNEATVPTPATPDVATITILTDGQEIPGTYHVVSVTVTKELNRIAKATLILLDGEASQQTFPISNAPDFLPGKEIEIQVGYRSQETTIFKGIIVGHNLKIRKTGAFLTVECQDEAVKMTLDRKSKYFTEVKDSDVMEELIGAYGLQSDVEATTVTYKELVQFDATDWDFLITRAEANGMVARVSDGEVKIAKPVLSGDPVLTLAYGNTILEFDVEMDARHQFKAVKTAAWNHATQELVEAEANEPPAVVNGNVSTDDLAGAMNVESFNLGHSGRLQEPELQSWADAKLLRQRLAKACGRVTCQGFAGIKPGNLLELTGVGERFEGKVFVSAVRQQIAAGNWETDVQFGIKPDWHVHEFEIEQPAAAGLLPPVSSLQIGIVTVLEGDPDGEDRIKVRLPVISTGDEGVWARIATLDAGDKRGTFFRPEIGDEVIVGFLNGDPRHPVVIGGVHSSAKPAPEPPKDDNHRKGYISRSEMKMVFDDEKKIFTLETPAGNKLVLSEDEKAITLEDQNGNKITMNSDGISLESAKDIILKATGDLKMEALKIEANASAGATIKSSATLNLEASATAVLKGALVQIN